MDLLNREINFENVLKYSHKAMATVFELIIVSTDKTYAEYVAKAAFDEVDKLENQLSRFLPNSEISLVNSLKAGDEVLLSEDTFECLLISQKMFELTEGIFDISVGQYKNKVSQKSDFPNMQKFELEESKFSFTVLSENLSIDLGGIGKGYALDKICELLIEWDITNAFIHGGGSSVKSIGSFQKFNGWPVTISNPGDSKQTIADILIKNFSLSASGIKKGEHIINPIEGNSIKNRNAAWAIADSAAKSDALSTAFMIMDVDKIMKICKENDYIEAMIIPNENDNLSNNDIIISDNFRIEKMHI